MSRPTTPGRDHDPESCALCQAYRAHAAQLAPDLAGEVAARVAELIRPLLRQAASQPQNRLLTVAEACEQLGMSRTAVYQLMYRGEFPSVQIPSENGGKSTRRIEQAAIDAFIARYRVEHPTTHGGAPGWTPGR